MLAVQAVQDYRALEASGDEVGITSVGRTKEETIKELEVSQLLVSQSYDVVI